MSSALAVPTDVADYDQVAAAVERIEDEMGPIDVWVNVAFTSVFARFDDIAPEEYRRATEVTYLGYVWGTKAVLPRMKQRNRGTIVHVGSALAYRGIPLQTAYCGAKHATQGFHEALRCELLHERSAVSVTMVQMPAVNTPQFSWVLNKLPEHAQPVAPIYQPEVAARAVVFAADHPRRREYWVGSSTVVTLMANAVVPGLLDRYLGRTGFSSQQTGEPSPRRPTGQPVEARRRLGRTGLRRPRRVRRPCPRGERPAVGGAPVPPGRRRGRRIRRRPGRLGDGATAMTGATTGSDRLSRTSGVLAALWGAALLTAGRDVWYVVDGRRPTPGDEAAVRFLGARHLTQGVLQAVMPSRFQRLYVAVDVTHAASMFWLAAVDERRRRPAVVSGVAALVAASVTLAREAGSSVRNGWRRTPPGRRRISATTARSRLLSASAARSRPGAPGTDGARHGPARSRSTRSSSATRSRSGSSRNAPYPTGDGPRGGLTTADRWTAWTWVGQRGASPLTVLPQTSETAPARMRSAVPRFSRTYTSSNRGSRP